MHIAYLTFKIYKYMIYTILFNHKKIIYFDIFFVGESITKAIN